MSDAAAQEAAFRAEQAAKLSAQAGDTGDVELQVQDVTNEEIEKIEAVIRALREKQWKNVDLEGYRREIIDRFAEIGFGAYVLVYEVGDGVRVEPGVYWFTYVVESRLGTAFDHEAMTHGIVNDTLDLGEGGTITMDGTVKDAPFKTSLHLPPGVKTN